MICDGCCDAQAVCHSGNDVDWCGARGTMCGSCGANQACLAGTCIQGSGGSGGGDVTSAGGGSGGGGGFISPAGGGTAGVGGGTAQGGGTSSAGGGTSGTGGGSTSAGGGSAGGSSSVGGGTATGGGGGSTMYPAPHSAYPKLLSYGGPVLSSPKFVSINFSNQAAATTQSLDDFVSRVGSTPFWSAATSEYGVGAGTANTPVHLMNENGPTTIDDAQIRTWLQGKLNGSHPEFGTPNSTTLYIIFYPPGSTVTMGGGTSCGNGSFFAYHSDVRLSNGTRVPYAVVPPCDDGEGVLLTQTASASHEMIEAATDPFPDANPAFSALDADHVVWEMILLDEASDLCAQDPYAFYQPAGFPYTVQRSWSNVAAAAGHDPCQPSLPGEVWFAAVPVLADTLTLTAQGQSFQTKGVKVAVGQSKSISVDLFSDAPRSNWSVAATDFGANELSFSFNRTSGNNGDRVTLTITANRANTQYGATPFAVVAVSGQAQHAYFGLAGQQ